MVNPHTSVGKDLGRRDSPPGLRIYEDMRDGFLGKETLTGPSGSLLAP